MQVDENNQKIAKVCFIMFGAYPLFNSNVKTTFGGAEVDVYNISRKLSQSPKYEVSLLVGDYGQKDIEYSDNIKLIKIKYMDLKKYNKLKYKILRYINLWKSLAFSEADIFFTKTAGEHLGWAAIIGKLTGKKLVYKMACDRDIDFEYRKKQGKKQYWLFKYGLKKTKVVISQTEVQKKILEKDIGMNSIVIKNAFDLSNLRKDFERSHILWVARALSRKQPELFIELAKRLPNENFVMIMPSNRETDDKTKSFHNINEITETVMEECRKYKNIEFIEFVPFNQIDDYFIRAKLFVNTSTFEGFPNTFIQACMSKTPILSFRVNPDDFINNNNVGFFCDNDMDKAVEFIRTLDKDNISVLGNNAFEYVKQNHNIDEVIVKYHEIIDGLIWSL